MVGDAFKALGDPTRRRILELLSEGEMSAGDIAAHFDMAKPSVSHHLNILKNAGLVTDERRGQNIVYCPALMLILMAALPRIDPKHQNYEKFKGVWNASLTALTIFMSAMSWFSELSVFGLIPEGSSLVGILVCGGCGVLFIFLGNYMPRIKQNYMFGCKTPWALNNEHNWNRTQRMGGIVFVVMGAALIVISLLATILGDAATMILLLAVVFGGSAWIYLYSYLVYIGKMK